MTGAARANQAVCFIGGAPHSGSTLLGMILGSHPAVVYGGELRKSTFLGDESKPLKKRVCKLCGPSCPIWGPLRHPLEPDVYEVLSRLTNKPLVVDSSKGTAWQSQQLALLTRAGVRTALVVLRRDGRAILASRRRKYPDVPPRQILDAWLTQIANTETFAATFPGPVVDVRYEALATRPAETIRRITEALGIPFDPAMLEFWMAAPHPLGGNDGTQFLVAREQARRATSDPRASGPPGEVLDLAGRTRAYYDAHPTAIVLDLRWQRELSAEDLALFDEVAGEANRRFAWPAVAEASIRSTGGTE